MGIVLEVMEKKAIALSYPVEFQWKVLSKTCPLPRIHRVPGWEMAEIRIRIYALRKPITLLWKGYFKMDTKYHGSQRIRLQDVSIQASEN